MAFLKTGLGTELNPPIRGHGVWLRQPLAIDYVPWAELRAMSREHLRPWEPQWARDELTRSAYRRRLRHYAREAREGVGYAYFIFRADDERLLGGLTLSNVRRGVSQSASLGYWLGEPYVRRGYMSAAVEAIARFGFEDLDLHRIEAACLPVNEASIRVLERCGFRREGLARRYLKINGEWQDHLLYARLDEDAGRDSGITEASQTG
ncbi:MAG: GNAT family N-acetyltransferase [Hyphomicrobiaceae bacterium]